MQNWTIHPFWKRKILLQDQSFVQLIHNSHSVSEMKLFTGERPSSPTSLPFNFVLLHPMLAVMKGFGMQILALMILVNGMLSFYDQRQGFNLWNTSRIPYDQSLEMTWISLLGRKKCFTWLKRPFQQSLEETISMKKFAILSSRNDLSYHLKSYN